MSDEFKGFARPTRNYFPMPNEWIDICAGIKSLAELKVVQYIIRHTWGYKEYDGTPKTITTDEFMRGRKRADGSRIDKGTGLSNRSVIDGLRDAEKHGYLVKDVDDADKARINKSYALKMVEAIPDVKMLHTSDVNNLHTEIRYEETSQPVCNPFTSTVKNVHSDYEETSHRSEKDTLERHLKKDTKERQEDTPLSFEKSHIIFEHYAGNETLYYHSACVDGHYGASEGMVLTAISLERAPQDAICGMCQSKIALAPFEVEKPLAPSDFLPDEQLAASYADEQGREMHALAAAYEDDYLTSEEDFDALEVDPTVHRMPAVKLNGATNATSTTDRQYPHAPGRSVDRLPVEATPVAIASTLDGAVAPPTAAVRQSYTSPAREAQRTPTVPEGHERNDGAATVVVGSEPRASGKRKGKKVTQAEPEPVPQEAIRIMDDWDILMKRACPRTEGHQAAAKALMTAHPTLGDLRAVWRHLFSTNPDWYRKKGVTLLDIAKNIGKWQSTQVSDDEPKKEPEKIGDYYMWKPRSRNAEPELQA